MRKNVIIKELAKILLGGLLAAFILLCLYGIGEERTKRETKRQLQDIQRTEWVRSAHENVHLSENLPSDGK